MIAIDTNIIVRFVTKDGAKQYSASRQLFKTEEIYIPNTVILETEWVLRFAYEFEPDEICKAFRKLFGLPNIKLSNEFTISQAITWHKSSSPAAVRATRLRSSAGIISGLIRAASPPG